MNDGAALAPGEQRLRAQATLDAARDLIGCVLVHGGSAGRIVETEAYHESEAACHAHIGLTGRTRVLLGPPQRLYVYRSYGIHALLNVVTESAGIGAAVLIRALEPLEGIELMRRRRGRAGRGSVEALCNGPGKLTQALAIDLELNDSPLGAAVQIRSAQGPRPELATGPRIGITKAVDLPWRFCDRASRSVSRPLPPGMRRRGVPGRPS